MEVEIDPIRLEPLKNYRGLIHAFSTRHYRCEEGLVRDLDFATGGSRDNFRLHQQWFLHRLGIDHREVFLVRQVHGNRVHRLDDPSDSVANTATVEADAIVTHLEGRPIGVLTADCVPIVVYDPERHAVAVIHAGRSGTAQKIFSKTVAVMKEKYGCLPEKLIAAMGPGICGACYEVDDSCIEPFRQGHTAWKSFTENHSEGKYKLDLFAANRADGLDAGMRPENLLQAGNCTSCEEDRFFSYRREGATGRLLTLAMLRPR